MVFALAIQADQQTVTELNLKLFFSPPSTHAGRVGPFDLAAGLGGSGLFWYLPCFRAPPSQFAQLLFLRITSTADFIGMYMGKFPAQFRGNFCRLGFVEGGVQFQCWIINTTRSHLLPFVLSAAR